MRSCVWSVVVSVVTDDVVCIFLKIMRTQIKVNVDAREESIDLHRICGRPKFRHSVHVVLMLASRR